MLGPHDMRVTVSSPTTVSGTVVVLAGSVRIARRCYAALISRSVLSCLRPHRCLDAIPSWNDVETSSEDLLSWGRQRFIGEPRCDLFFLLSTPWLGLWLGLGNLSIGAQMCWFRPFTSVFCCYRCLKPSLAPISTTLRGIVKRLVTTERNWLAFQGENTGRRFLWCARAVSIKCCACSFFYLSALFRIWDCFGSLSYKCIDLVNICFNIVYNK